MYKKNILNKFSSKGFISSCRLNNKYSLIYKKKTFTIDSRGSFFGILNNTVKAASLIASSKENDQVANNSNTDIILLERQ